ncbi:hypothetical protein LTR85_003894 [Meristemomyces frigidus]|nr:hypothetical protein LTR85_003894 [Meristemomyces frigidus]
MSKQPAPMDDHSNNTGPEPERLHLQPTAPTSQSDLEAVRQWLGSKTTSTPQSLGDYSLEVLRRALSWAVGHMHEKLDRQLSKAVEDAQELAIEVTEDMVFDGRLDELDNLSSTGAREMTDKEEVMLLLEKAREELAWVLEEIAKLRRHIHGDTIFLAAGKRTSFAYLPTPRRL